MVTACPSETALADFVSGAMSQADVAAVEAHVDDCDGCRALLSLLAKGWGSAQRTLASLHAAPFPAPANAPGTPLGTRFAIEDVAAVGGMGVIYRAHDVNGGELVALKVLARAASSTMELLEQEAQVLAELRHPGIVRYVCHGALEPQGIFLAMEWLEGEDLGRRLERGRPSAAESIALAEGVARALGAAHQRGVIHRDIKPSNVFLVGGRMHEPKLLDFGLARIAGAEVSNARLFVGTPRYMSPEQARGRADVDARADVFALGCVLFECLAGRPAFAADRIPALLGKIVMEQPPRLRELAEVPPAVDDLVARMLEKDPERRPADGTEVARALEGIRRAMEWAPLIPEAAPALTTHELRVASAVVASGGGDAALALAGRGRAAVAAYGGRVETLRDGSLLVTFTRAGAATDQAARAARSALELRRLLPQASIALATGRTNAADDRVVGDVIERAADLLASGAAAPAIRIDDVTERLLDARFEIGADDHGVLLRGAREEEATRTLLGHPTPCVGRDAELVELCTTVERSIQERRAQAVLLVAPPGVGKSRLRDELVRAAPVEAWFGWGDPIRAGSTFGMAADVVRRISDLRGGEPLAVRQEKLRARVAKTVPPASVDRVTEFLAEIVGAPFAVDASVHLRAARQDPKLMGDQIRRAFIDLCEAECMRGPLLLVLEDLHWGDVSTVELLGELLRVLETMPITMLALARPEALELFPQLWRCRLCRTMSLEPLAPEAAATLVRFVLGDAPREVVDRIVERAGGNAYFLEELIRAAAESPGDAAPATVVAMTQARLEALRPAARKVLRAASIFGQSFWGGGVAALTAGDSAGALHELVRRELVVMQPRSRFEGEPELAFRHDIVRQAAYEMLLDDDRALGHRLAGEWLEGAGETDALVLAEHFERGGAPERAVGWYLRGAEHALAGDDLVAAIARADAGARCGATGHVLGSLRRVRCEAHRWRGENAEAEAEAGAALALADQGSDPWCDAARTFAVAAGNLGHIERVQEVVQSLRTAAGRAPLSCAGVVAGIHAATELLGAARYGTAAELLDDMDRAEAAADPTVRAHVVYARAIQAFLVGDPAEYLERMSASVDFFEHAGDRRNVARARVNLGFGYFLLGLVDEAESCLREALVIAERTSLGHVAALAKHNLGLVLLRKGLVADAIALETESVEIFRAQGHRRLEGCSRDYLAVILTQAGDLRAAEREARAALGLLRAAAPTRAPRAAAVLAQVLLARGRAADALEAAEQGMEVASGIGWVPDEPFIRLVHAEALAANGKATAAGEAFALCRERLLAAADRIRDPSRRRSFLERVPENARVIELAEAHACASRNTTPPGSS
jgi:eukaryotic-like serine/threonine-protein kinase